MELQEALDAIDLAKDKLSSLEEVILALIESPNPIDKSPVMLYYCVSDIKKGLENKGATRAVN